MSKWGIQGPEFWKLCAEGCSPGLRAVSLRAASTLTSKGDAPNVARSVAKTEGKALLSEVKVWLPQAQI